MNKDDLVKILVVLIALGFITELFFLGQGYRTSLSGGGGQNVTGFTVFNGTIRTYDPVLAINANTSQSIVDQLKATNGVKNVQTQQGLIVIQTETRDDVFPLASMLREKNVTAYSVANIAIPALLFVDTGTEVLNVTVPSGIVRVEVEPFLDAGSEVTVKMVAVSSDGVLTGYQSAQILAQTINLQVNATIVSLDKNTYRYSIPWGSRNMTFNSTDYSLQKDNGIVFQPPLSVVDILAKKKLPYITYIDANTAEVSPDFTDLVAVITDFPQTNVTFPSSTLIVIANETPDIVFNYTALFSYKVSLPKEISGYSLDTTQMVMVFPEKHVDGENVSLTISGLAVGNRLLSVKPS